MNCPACKTRMFVMEYERLELDHCPQCAGAWFDAGELALLFADPDGRARHDLVPDVLTALPDAESGEKARRCPVCRHRMRKVNIGPNRGVLVDACGRGHGFFFDRGEIADLVADLDIGADNLPARVRAFLGGVLGRDLAANDPEET
ncbi:MAG TPA: zf-TFIIB domain-containing protein [Candidatus Krumholzibacteria bacterium]|nr:zf-TFIIB domain-containing protein [Candidatus Krumholzibacteria bacterium]HPD71850.1 zf-TFIIB domain-containing protein [Candidatus Krumholzibacteria bacterium]HRY41217.1 zf-TFIIB domain-containing protein [Candidatus Krumholzibacteria bacterium]